MKTSYFLMIDLPPPIQRDLFATVGFEPSDDLPAPCELFAKHGDELAKARAQIVTGLMDPANEPLLKDRRGVIAWGTYLPLEPADAPLAEYLIRADGFAWQNALSASLALGLQLMTDVSTLVVDHLGHVHFRGQAPAGTKFDGLPGVQRAVRIVPAAASDLALMAATGAALAGYDGDLLELDLDLDDPSRPG